MKKKIFKRSLALGALMAFVITGSAMAAEEVIPNNVEKNITTGITTFSNIGITFDENNDLSIYDSKPINDLIIKSSSNSIDMVNTSSLIKLNIFGDLLIEGGDKGLRSGGIVNASNVTIISKGNAIATDKTLDIKAVNILTLKSETHAALSNSGNTKLFAKNMIISGKNGSAVYNTGRLDIGDESSKVGVLDINGGFDNGDNATAKIYSMGNIKFNNKSSANNTLVKNEGNLEIKTDGNIIISTRKNDLGEYYNTASAFSNAKAEKTFFEAKQIEIDVNNTGLSVSTEATFNVQKLDITANRAINAVGNTAKLNLNCSEVNLLGNNDTIEVINVGNGGNVNFNNVETLDIQGDIVVKTNRLASGINTSTLNLSASKEINIIGDIINAGDNSGDEANDKKYSGGNININEEKNTGVVIKIQGDIYAGQDKNGINQLDGISSVNLNLMNEESVLNGSIYDLPDDTGSSKVVALTLSNNAQWNVSDESVISNLDLGGNTGQTGGIVNNKNAKTINVKKLSGQGTLNVVDGKADQMIIGDKAEDAKLTVATTNPNVKFEDLPSVASMENGSQAINTIQKTGGDVFSLERADINQETGAFENVNKIVDSANINANDMTAIGLMTWRAGTNDMNKRMGELRNTNGEHGVWMRMVRGEQEYKNIKNQYNQYQLGYDEKLSVDKRWTVGAAISYIDAKNSFGNGNGESTDKSLAIYGSKLNNDGSFVDLIAKYGRLENDFKLYSGMEDADYSTNAYSFSAEFGKRFEQGKGMWIEPQVELTYGKVSAVDYVSSRSVKVAQDSMESIIGRVGFRLGKDIKQGNVYARASYLYDFDGETSAILNDAAKLTQDLGGGWWEVGIGANINLSKATYIYADVEKTFGGEVDTNWQWNLGVRYSF